MKPLTSEQAKFAPIILYKAVELARRTCAGWYLRKRKPTQDELMQIMNYMAAAESIFLGDEFSMEKAGAVYSMILGELDDIDAEDAA